jgi:hypothetical protein
MVLETRRTSPKPGRTYGGAAKKNVAKQNVVAMARMKPGRDVPTSCGNAEMLASLLILAAGSKRAAIRMIEQSTTKGANHKGGAPRGLQSRANSPASATQPDRATPTACGNAEMLANLLILAAGSKRAAIRMIEQSTTKGANYSGGAPQGSRHQKDGLLFLAVCLRDLQFRRQGRVPPAWTMLLDEVLKELEGRGVRVHSTRRAVGERVAAKWPDIADPGGAVSFERLTDEIWIADVGGVSVASFGNTIVGTPGLPTVRWLSRLREVMREALASSGRDDDASFLAEMASESAADAHLHDEDQMTELTRGFSDSH